MLSKEYSVVPLFEEFRTKLKIAMVCMCNVNLCINSEKAINTKRDH